MGCVSSKIVRRSRSFQEELTLSLQRRTNGVSRLEELFAKSNGGGEQLLALFCTANTVATRLRALDAAPEHDKPSLPPSEPEHDEKPSITDETREEEPTGPETINTWELMADLEEEDGDDQVEQERDHTQRQQQHLLEHPRKLAGSSSQKDGGALRTMVTEDPSPLVLVESDDVPSMGCQPDSYGQVPRVDNGRGQESQDNEVEDQDRDGTGRRSLGGPKGYHCPFIKAKPEMLGAHSMELSRSSSRRSGSADAQMNGMAADSSLQVLKGLRRRAMAKELKTLEVPTPSFEFCSVGSLREWLGGVGASSLGSYVTPKFGSFGFEAAVAAGSGGEAAEREEGILFDPQLVADLEEAMERMNMEEEDMLRQIMESLTPGESHEEDTKDCRNRVPITVGYCAR